MSLALLDHSENTEADEVGALPEDVGQLQQGRVDEDGERVLGEQPRELDDGLALLSQPVEVE